MRDPLFKGCTRPAMALGVPLTPLAVVGGVIVLVSLWFTIFMLLLLPLAILFMRWVVQSDDQQFRLLGLKMLFRLANANGSFWKSSVYSPYRFKKRKL